MCFPGKRSAAGVRPMVPTSAHQLTGPAWTVPRLQGSDTQLTRSLSCSLKKGLLSKKQNHPEGPKDLTLEAAVRPALRRSCRICLHACLHGDQPEVSAPPASVPWPSRG